MRLHNAPHNVGLPVESFDRDSAQSALLSIRGTCKNVYGP